MSGLWINQRLSEQVKETLKDAAERRREHAEDSHAMNKGFLNELTLHYYHAQRERGDQSGITNVDIDLVSRRWVNYRPDGRAYRRIEYMAWEFKSPMSKLASNGQQSALNELSIAISLGQEAGLYDDRWSGVWVAIISGIDADPEEMGLLARVIPPHPISNYSDDRPTVVTAPIPMRLVDLLAILKHAIRPRLLLERVMRQPPVLLDEAMRPR